MIEQHQRELVVARHQLEEEAVERAPRVLQPLADHAVADVEQHGEADRHALAGELRDGLRQAVFEHLEVVLRQIGHEPAAGVGDRGGDRHDLDAGLELRRLRRQTAVPVPGRRLHARQPHGGRERDGEA